ncbi:MAG TPA: dehydratase, partial [Acidovorax sp.]|nr:dehydratase [Acidovorax sp.]
MTDTHARSASMAGKSPIYLDDLAVGDQFKSGEHAMDEAQITSFAAQFDPQPFHLDDAAARDTLFGGLAASGWHTGGQARIWP